MLYSLLVVVWIPFSQTTIGSNVNSDTLLDFLNQLYIWVQSLEESKVERYTCKINEAIDEELRPALW